MRLFRSVLQILGLLIALSCLPAWAWAASQYVQWGNQMLQKKNYDDAIKYFNGAVRADSNDAAAYKGLGYAYAYKGDKAKALEYLNRSLQIDPSDSALKGYVDQLGAAGAPASAGTAAQALQYGNYYLRQKNYDPAIAWYNKATQAEPDNARAWQAMGNAYYGKGDKSNAVMAWEHSVSLDPGNTQLAAYLTQIKGSAAKTTPQADASLEAGPATNPWVMGGTVAVLGAVMLFIF